ncbi:MAG: helix-turn-helix transcriptional regulator, partial [Oscillospiraceae bacterium]
YFMHIFKKDTGMSFSEYLLKYRFEKAKELLSTGRYKVYDVCKMVGFNDPKYFSKIFKRETGVTPKKYTDSL